MWANSAAFNQNVRNCWKTTTNRREERSQELISVSWTQLDPFAPVQGLTGHMTPLLASDWLPHKSGPDFQMLLLTYKVQEVQLQHTWRSWEQQPHSWLPAGSTTSASRKGRSLPPSGPLLWNPVRDRRRTRSDCSPVPLLSVSVEVGGLFCWLLFRWLLFFCCTFFVFYCSLSDISQLLCFFLLKTSK